MRESQHDSARRLAADPLLSHARALANDQGLEASIAEVTAQLDQLDAPRAC